jgi:outer membrane biosynthesis protein TonB
LREALAAADHDFVLSEPASKLKVLREALRTVRRRGLSRTARQGRRYFRVVAAGFFVATVAIILLNALAWQRTRHPAPLFARAAPVSPAREPRIAEMIARPAPRPQPAVPPVQMGDKPIERPPAQKMLLEKPPLETAAGEHPRQTRVNASPAKPQDRISQLLKAPPAPRPRSTSAAPAAATTATAAPSKSVLAAQRALVKLGFVLKPDGVAGVTTRRAVESYERDHGLPIWGELTPTLMRRLSTETGISGTR